jgi:hypothetical protein
VGSLRFSECVPRATTRMTALVSVLLLGAGCATVKPHEKELLSDRAMVYGSGGPATQQEAHVLDNREGSTNASASGGGCGCN